MASALRPAICGLGKRGLSASCETHRPSHVGAAEWGSGKGSRRRGRPPLARGRTLWPADSLPADRGLKDHGTEHREAGPPDREGRGESWTHSDHTGRSEWKPFRGSAARGGQAGPGPGSPRQGHVHPHGARRLPASKVTHLREVRAACHSPSRPWRSPGAALAQTRLPSVVLRVDGCL